ncbi:ROK family transcriptional regulator [Gordonia sp. SL306]|uniref:ROK family transcriptional regulator n=1 Tax=Gordonia sp. SL306 TaxID=2995145 RepID=UPI002271450C|nr:ROK family protein [Gordonia sp. SL306]WAC53886.1 ROK family protein [Gordonia sp. SL306]
MLPTGVVPAALQVGSIPAAAVLQAVRVNAPVTRDHLAAATSLSPATINRQVTILSRLGLVVERPDLVDPGGIGRPKNPLTLDRDKLCVAGMHIGARRTLLAIADLGGRTLYSHAVRTPHDESEVGDLCRQLRELAARFGGRRLLWAGVASGGLVDAATGVIDHPVLGWRRVPIGTMLSAELGVPVSVCEHVQAMAAAELLLTYPREFDGTALFFYARETVGMAMTIDGKVHMPLRGAGTIGHLPVNASVLAPAGAATLQQVIGSSPARRAAERLEVPDDAAQIVDDRAEVLGAAVAMLRDVINPDAIVVSGDAFAAHPDGLAPVQAAFDKASTTLRPLEIAPSRFGIRVQESAAVVVALSVIYADPVGATATD